MTLLYYDTIETNEKLNEFIDKRLDKFISCKTFKQTDVALGK